MKDLTGGDTLTGRLPYGTAAISFQPTHKRVVVDNHMPNIRDTSSGMWGRVGLVSFNVVVPLDQRDRHLLQKLKAEGSGVLSKTRFTCRLCGAEVQQLPDKRAYSGIELTTAGKQAARGSY